MVRIAEGEHPKDIKESNYFTPQGEYRIDDAAPKIFTDSLMYKTSFYRFGEVATGYQNPAGYDRTRNQEVGIKNIKLTHVEEAFTSEHWLVRIYRVKDVPNIGKKAKTKKSKNKTDKTRKKTSRKGVFGKQPYFEPGKKSRSVNNELLF